MGSRCAVGAVAALLAAAIPAWAQAELAPVEVPVSSEQHVEVGVGENSFALFDDPRFAATGIRHVRLIVPYDVVDAGGRRLRRVDAWLRLARQQGLEPLISFGFSQRRRMQWHLPTTAEYEEAVAQFRARYPWVRDYSTWNEANHKMMQPTGLHPVRTAALYRALRRQCPLADCRVVAADVLLTSSRRTWRWISVFRRHAGPGPHIWGLHNYPDANRLTSRLTRRFLRWMPDDEIWFTETGGIVRFVDHWRRDEYRAARVVSYVFRLAELSPRITRLYLYNWRAASWNRHWDSGLIGVNGRSRLGYYSLLDALSLDRFKPRPPAPEAPTEPPAKPTPLIP
jgi:hypothetical protein